LQDQILKEGYLVYERIALKCSEWNQNCNKASTKEESVDNSPLLSLGLVVGATDIDALKSVRTLSPESWILCPGVGAQGGSAIDVCSAGLREGKQVDLYIVLSLLFTYQD
jgi:orotidine-5'-phosphate decarboxylase